MHEGVNHTTLILGGARSGKSAYAERLLAAHANPVYVATGQPFDDEMRVRIDQHRARRPAHWRTIEAPIELPAALARCNAPTLIDDLAIWLTNLLLSEADLESHVAALEGTLTTRAHPTILVSSETGLGIVPADPLSRRFRDEAGLLNQRVAALADEVLLIVAGLPLRLK
jgi:adenosyl cobinamide kinase/adenosyl cobinamide phosphate guanylyltransferase